MPDVKNNLYLYEAIELRREFELRKKILNNLLSKQVENSRVMNDSDRLSRSYFTYRYRRSEKQIDNKLIPIPELDISKIRKNIRKLEFKWGKLNNAIQKINHTLKLEINNESMTLAEALDLRKYTHKRIDQLRNELNRLTFGKIIYKEGRNVEVFPDGSFKETEEELEFNMLLYRELTRKTRKISFETTVQFKDEH